MISNRKVEIGVGLFVILGIGALLMLAMKVSNIGEFVPTETYDVVARFDNIGGLKVRSPVTMAGVRIGRVKSIEFDGGDFVAEVTVAIEAKFNELPTDTSASIFTAGLLGEQYIGLEAGADMDFLTAGSEIEITQSAVVLEQLIGQFMLNKAAESKSE